MHGVCLRRAPNLGGPGYTVVLLRRSRNECERGVDTEGSSPEMQLIFYSLQLYIRVGILLVHPAVHDAYMYVYANCFVDFVTCLNPCDSSKRGDQVIKL